MTVSEERKGIASIGMVSKKILVLLGHPDKSGFCGEMANAYESAARGAGHTVERMNVGEMQIEPIPPKPHL